MVTCAQRRLPPLPTTVSILTEQPRPGQTRRTAAGDFQGTFREKPVKVGCWLLGLGTLAETHFFPPEPERKAGLVRLLPKETFRLKFSRNHHPWSSFSLLGWRNPLKTRLQLGLVDHSLRA